MTASWSPAKCMPFTCLLCTSAFPSMRWRNSSPHFPSGGSENIPAVNFNLQLARIRKMYPEGKVNRQKACSGRFQSKSWPLLTSGDKGLGVAVFLGGLGGPK